MFRSRKADRLKLIYWDGSGIVLAHKRLEEQSFIWPGIKDGLMTLSHAQFEALFAGLDWRRVHAVQMNSPEFRRHPRVRFSAAFRTLRATASVSVR